VYLSSIPVETGNDPSRSWPGKLWIGNAYRVHQRLCMAFDGALDERHRFVTERFAPPPPPLDAKRKEQPPRSEGVGFLFRIESPIRTRRGLRPRILVQSLTEPDWDAAFGNAPFLVVGEDIEVRQCQPQHSKGQKLRFRLRANPSVKKKREGKKNSARVGLTKPEEQLAWLERKAEQGGFRVLALESARGGYQHSRRSREIDPSRHVHMGVSYEGILSVADVDQFNRHTLPEGIGPAKAYGFGLLSVAPA